MTCPELLSTRTGRPENKRAAWLLDKVESDLFCFSFWRVG